MGVARLPPTVSCSASPRLAASSSRDRGPWPGASSPSGAVPGLLPEGGTPASVAERRSPSGEATSRYLRSSNSTPGLGEDVLRGPALRASLVVPDGQVSHASERRGVRATGSPRRWSPGGLEMAGVDRRTRRSRGLHPSGSSSQRTWRSCGARPIAAAAAAASVNGASSTCGPGWRGRRAGHRGRGWRRSSPPARALGPARDFGYSVIEGPDERASSAGAGSTAGSTITASRSATGCTSTASGRASPPRCRALTRRGLRHPRHRAGAHPVRRAERPQRRVQKLGYAFVGG